MKHIYFLGIGGTLMGSLAQLAKALGYVVSGSDRALYPPMSDQLDAAGINVHEGFDPTQLEPAPDLVVVGNAGLPRGHEAIEYILNKGLPYTSGAAWLGEVVLRDRWVLAASGTHGKSTTASMLAWVLEHAGLSPGYLIGGVPKNLELSARLGDTPFFVVEADEYDTSYFDRRSKFVHYRPRTLIINNLEYDHADIFPDLAAIQTQFNHVLRTVPGEGLVIAPSADDNVDDTLKAGCWTPVARFGREPVKHGLPTDSGVWFHPGDAESDGSAFEVCLNGQALGRVEWQLLGAHNVNNALAAIVAARHAGVAPEVSIEALSAFEGVKRRLEVIYDDGRTRVYDDFAHHPTAIRSTLEGLRKSVGSDEIIAVIEPRTHTMSLGTLRNELKTCAAPADQAIWFRGENIKWDVAELASECVVPSRVFDDVDRLVEHLSAPGARRRHIVIMSNGSFGGIYGKLTDALKGNSKGE